MDAWNQIRLVARRCHADALDKSNGNREARSLIEAITQLNDLELNHFIPGEQVSDGVMGFLDRPALMINIAQGLPEDEEAVVIAHELGHFFLHEDPRNEVNQIDHGLSGDKVDSGAGVVHGYSPREQKEIQADVFAGEFLCPSDWLKQESLSGQRPSKIAERLGLPPHVVMNQAIRALLLPELKDERIASDKIETVIELDESQQEAVDWRGGPLLVDAGPGTGKTRTLVSRIKALLENDVSPASILALTFSNKAADEMRERIYDCNEDAAIEMWLGTFHAFGLELIQKWPEEIGRSISVRVLDQTQSLALLEDNLSLLSLTHYQNLYEPAYELVEILKVISRCKDEMISPEEYKTEAMFFFESADTDNLETAEKTIEIAKAYQVYEDLLKENDAVDYGDLVMKAAQLLESNTTVQNYYLDRFEHILVDEYQDVNLASARLLRALSSDKTGIWVVADQRQSIYRFRGAEPTNVTRFESEFSGIKKTLKYNYRSGEPVVRTFDTFASSMQNAMSGGWTAYRGSTGSITMTVAKDVASEAEAIHDQIKRYRDEGIPYTEQVILGRSHLTLGRICNELERLGVPLLYMGDLFERSEIRDLLSLVALDAEFGGIGLVRVATLPEYGATRSDALTIIHWANDKNINILEALGKLDDIDGLTDQGRGGLTLLNKHLDGMGPETTPWTMLTTWLFERSNYLDQFFSINDAKAQQCLIAIYQLLKVCGEHMSVENPTRKKLVARIRRIEKLEQDKSYRAVSSEASNMDAVRVMTVHGSKGLEFDVVHLPAISTGYMPSTYKGVRNKPPPTLIQLSLQKDDHEAEEECLFFVALSRSKDHLSLSRAERYTSRNASASKFIDRLNGHLSTQRTAETIETETKREQLNPQEPQKHYYYKTLETYIDCPAKYSYENIDNLFGWIVDNAYVGFHRCISRTVGWLEDQQQSGSSYDLTKATEYLDTQWDEVGPSKHANSSYYKAIAKSSVEKLVELYSIEEIRYERAQWDVNLNGKTISITPDRVFIDSNEIIHVQRIRNSRPTKSEPTKPVYALLRLGAQQRFPGKKVIVETLYPATGDTILTDSKKDTKHLREYADAIAKIEQGAFPANANPRVCPSCPCYFICGS